MRVFAVVSAGTVIAGVLCCAGWLHAQNATANPASIRATGLPPRLTAADYQFHAQSGSITLAAEFTAHGIPTEEGGPYSTDGYVVVLAALFGAPGAKIELANKDFSLRINGKKPSVLAQPFELIRPSLKDPDWEPLDSEKQQAMTASAGGQRAGQPQFKQAPPKMPIERRHLMEQRVLKASLPEGERPLPQSGLLFFEWRTDLKNIHSMELEYNGPAGKATLALEKP